MKIKIINECMLYGEVVKVGDVLDLDSVLATSAISFGNAQAYEEAAEAAVEEPELTEDQLTVALEETPVAAVASVNKTKKGSKK